MEKNNFYDVIVGPAVTEKTSSISEYNQIVFNVMRKASKLDIKKAVEKIFNVKVKAVNTFIRKGKKKRFKGVIGHRNDIKRAIITLKEGETIDVTASF